MQVYLALTRPKLKRGAEWKLTTANDLFTLLMLVTALMSHAWWVLGVAALFSWPGQWILRPAAAAGSRAARLCAHARGQVAPGHSAIPEMGEVKESYG